MTLTTKQKKYLAEIERINRDVLPRVLADRRELRKIYCNPADIDENGNYIRDALGYPLVSLV
jgi:hypothetical protein